MIVRGRRVIAAELALFAVTVTVVFAFARLFTGSEWRAPLLASAVVAHGLTAVGRRLQVGVGMQLVLVVVAMILLANWTLAPDDLRWGLPTAASFTALGDALTAAAGEYPSARAPIAPDDGFVLASMVGIALVGFMASIAAFSLRAPLQALVPPFTLFVLGALLGSGEHQVAAALSFLVATMAFALCSRGVEIATATTWLPGDDRRGPDALMRAGAALIGITVVAAALAGPALPGAADAAVWTWRGRGGDGTLQVTSPLVTLRSRLVNQSRTIVFTVESPRPAYWRLMALDEFDGEQWTANGRFRGVDGTFGMSMAGAVDRTVAQTVTIADFRTDYLPAAYAPIEINSDDRAPKWDDRSSTLFVDDPAVEGTRYQVTSILPAFDADQLRAADGEPPTGVLDRYLGLPTLDPSVAALAVEVTADAPTRYDRAVALQDWFRTEFAYSTDVPDGAGGDRLVAFLFQERAGYCEQFAAAYAAMARTLGIPSRVAVGFTEGDQSRARPEHFTVRGEDAHAWPELYFDGLGWVAFEPTPGRVAPGSSAWTGLVHESELPEDDSTPTSTPGVTAPPTIPDLDIPAFEDPGGGAAPVTPGDDGIRPHPVLVWTAGLVAVAAGWLLLVSGMVALRRTRRRRGAGDDRSAEVGVAWAEAVETLTWRGRAPRPSETYIEYALRLASSAPSTHPELGELAELGTRARYAPTPVDAATRDRAHELSAAVVRRTVEGLPWWRRLLRLGDPRRLRPARARAQRQRAMVLTSGTTDY